MPTLSAAETALALRTGSWLTLAGTVFTGSSPIAAFQDAISEGLAFCGVPPADPSAVTTDDVGRLPNALWYRFLDVAELRVLETAGSSLINRGQSQRWEDYSVTRDMVSFQAHLADLRRNLRVKWGYGAGFLSTGTIDLNFAAKCRREF